MVNSLSLCSLSCIAAAARAGKVALFFIDRFPRKPMMLMYDFLLLAATLIIVGIATAFLGRDFMTRRERPGAT